jgi:hypothetical protein
MDPKDYWLYKKFEAGLELSETNTPCADRGFKNYDSSPTHGVYPIKMTLDLYKP